MYGRISPSASSYPRANHVQCLCLTRVDLTRIDGVDAYTAMKVLSEIGADMTKWPSAKHFASWLGLSPNNRITGGRVMSSKTKPSANRAAAALRLAANALHRSGGSALVPFPYSWAEYGNAQARVSHDERSVAEQVDPSVLFSQSVVVVLGAFLRRKKAHLGAPKAITVTAHKLARLIYSMLRNGQEYVDAGNGILRDYSISSGRCVPIRPELVGGF